MRWTKAGHDRLSPLVGQRTRDLIEAQQRLEETNQDLERRVQAGIAALREAERMAAYGTLVAAVAHEVRHPIFAIQSAAYVLAERLGRNADLEPQLKILEQETRRMTAVMDDLLEFARPPQLLLGSIDPLKLLRDAAETFRATEPDLAVEFEAGDRRDLPRVRADRDRIHQVLINLMQNAQKHADGATTITLGVEPRAGERPAVLLEVTDNGAGIAPQNLQRIFEPFFTAGRGTGLGLPIARRIVQEHGGSIEVESAPGSGASFRVVLPIGGPEDGPG